MALWRCRTEGGGNKQHLTEVISGLQNLFAFAASMNHLTGSFPDFVSNCLSVFVDNNRLAGSIPETLLPMGLMHMRASWNLFEGTFPSIPTQLLMSIGLSGTKTQQFIKR